MRQGSKGRRVRCFMSRSWALEGVTELLRAAICRARTQLHDHMFEMSLGTAAARYAAKQPLKPLNHGDDLPPSSEPARTIRCHGGGLHLPPIANLAPVLACFCCTCCCPQLLFRKPQERTYSLGVDNADGPGKG